MRLALEVARHGGDEQPVRLTHIAKLTGISRGFLEQLAIALKSHSLLRGVSGRNGGYLLARPADQITIGQVLNAVIGPINLSVCAAEPNLCMSSEFCECRLVWQLLRQRINDVLSEYTLADILDRNWAESVRNRLREATHNDGLLAGGM